MAPRNKILIEAEKFCIKNKERLSQPRREVLKIIATSPVPLRICDILSKLGLVFNNPKPPTVHRALEFWIKNNFIHKVESLNCYVACELEHTMCSSHFMICQICHNVSERSFTSLPELLLQESQKHDFLMRRFHLEIHGVCQSCQGASKC